MTLRFDVRRHAGPALAVLAMLLPPALAAQPVAWSGHVGLASDWLLRGLRLSDGGAPVVHAGADVYAGSFSGGASVMRLRAAGGRWTDAWTLRAGGAWRLDADTVFVADLQRLRYGEALRTWDGRQLTLGLLLGDRAAVYWNHERLREPVLDADSLDAALRWPLAPQWRLAGGLGYAWHALGAPYVYGQAGLEWHDGGARVQLQRVWTHGAGPPLAGPDVAARWVAGVGWVF